MLDRHRRLDQYGSHWSSSGKRKGHDTPAPGLTFKAEGSTVGFNDNFGDGKTNSRILGSGHPPSGVFYYNINGLLIASNFYSHPVMPWPKFDGVADQVRKHANDALPIKER